MICGHAFAKFQYANEHMDSLAGAPPVIFNRSESTGTVSRKKNVQSYSCKLMLCHRLTQQVFALGKTQKCVAHVVESSIHLCLFSLVRLRQTVCVYVEKRRRKRKIAHNTINGPLHINEKNGLCQNLLIPVRVQSSGLWVAVLRDSITLKACFVKYVFVKVAISKSGER